MKLIFLILFLFSTAKAQLLNPPQDSTINFTDITTNNASPTKHGFLPKLQNTGSLFLRDDGTWQSTGGAGSGFNIIGTLNSLTKSTNGASSTGTTLVMQTADKTNAGLISVGTQTISGDKTMNLTDSTVSSSTLFGNTISGTTTFGGVLNNNGVISSGIVSATTLRGVITNTDSINGGIVSQTTISGTTALNGTLNLNNNLIAVSGTGMDFSAGMISPTTVSTSTVTKIYKGTAWGTFTPSFKGGTSDSSAITYSVQAGDWTRTNNWVCVKFQLTLTALTGGGGALSVSGMPFVVASNDTSRGGGGANLTDKSGWTTSGPDYFRATGNTHAVLLLKNGNTANTAINVNNLSSTSNIGLGGCYITSE